MICVECGCAVDSVYREFSRGNIRLTACPSCGAFAADRYVEYDLTLLAIDLMLLKLAAYRHAIFNLSAAGVQRSMLKLLPTLLCLDLYLAAMRQAAQPVSIVLEAARVACYWTVIILAAGVVRRMAPAPPPDAPLKPTPSTPLLFALILSSLGKLFALLPLIWSAEYAQIDLVARGLHAFVVASNVRAVSVHLSVSTATAAAIVAVGLVGQFAMDHVKGYA